MKRNVLLAIIGTLAFLCFLVAKAPASLISHMVPDQAPVSIQAPSGTLWNGRIGQLQAGQFRMGPIDWNLRPSRLFLLRLDADIEGVVADGRVSARAIVTTGGHMEVREAIGQQLPLAQLAPLFGQSPSMMDGEAAFDIPRLTFRDFQPWAGEGQIRVFDLRSDIMGMRELGNFGGEADGEEGEFRIDLTDAGDEAPFALNGQILFQAENRHYQLEGRIRARDHAPDDLANGLQYLGQADEDGYYPVSLSGRL